MAFLLKRRMGILHSSAVTEKVPCDIMASATPPLPTPPPSLEATVMKESPLSEISPRPRHSTQPHFLPFLALSPRHSVFFFYPTFAALLTLPAHCQWVLMDSDGCIMNMYAIEAQSCCCLEALYASLNVLLHILKHRDRGT